MTSTATQLKAILARRNAVVMPGTPNALFANVIERLGYECAYVTGAGIANMYLGAPDIGLLTMTEIANHVAVMADSVGIPLLVDGDTGFGNAINTRRAVQVLERAGAAGIQFEDQVFPKKCGHFSGKAVIGASDMVQKIKAAVDARRDGDFQIVARTDALAVEGIEAALDRAQAYAEAGADATFVEAPETAAQIARIAALPVPQIINLVHGGRTPELPHETLAQMGFGAKLYANAVLQAALLAVEGVLTDLRDTRTLDGLDDRLASFAARQQAVRKDEFDAMERTYA